MGCFDAKTKSSLPKWLLEPTKKIASQANTALDQNFVSYDKPLVAGQTTAQTDSMAMLKNLLGENGSGMALPRVIDDVPGAAGGKAGSTADYMDPYLEQVLSPIMRNINISREQANMSNDAAANMAGAFGDKGHGLERAETNERAILAGSDATGKAYSDAYSSAMGLKQADINRMGNTRDQTSQLINQMFGMGEQQQKTEQAGLTADFSEFLRKEGFTTDQLAKIASIRGTLNGSTTTSPSTASSILGAGSGIASIIAAL